MTVLIFQMPFLKYFKLSFWTKQLVGKITNAV